MTSIHNDFAVLLEAPNPVEAELARDLLASHGIPSMLHGQDRDLAELGSLVHNSVSRPDLLVPHAALAQAKAILAEAWDADSLDDDMAIEAVEEEPPPGALRSPAWVAVLVVVLAALVSVMCVRDYFPKSRAG